MTRLRRASAHEILVAQLAHVMDQSAVDEVSLASGDDLRAFL
jgi:hypothetical protein